jgi:hypothetical protein
MVLPFFAGYFLAVPSDDTPAELQCYGDTLALQAARSCTLR